MNISNRGLSWMINKINKISHKVPRSMIIPLMYVILVLFIWRNVLLSKTFLSYDTSYLSIDNYLVSEGNTFYTWNHFVSKSVPPSLLSYHLLGYIFKYLGLSIFSFVKFLIVLIYTLMFVSSYLLLKYLLKYEHVDDRHIEIISCVGSLIFGFFPYYTILLSWRLDWVFGYALFPLYILLIFKAYYENKVRYAILAGLLLTFLGFNLRLVSFYLMIAFILLIIGNARTNIWQFIIIISVFVSVSISQIVFLYVSYTPGVTTAETTALIRARFSKASLVYLVRGISEITADIFYAGSMTSKILNLVFLVIPPLVISVVMLNIRIIRQRKVCLASITIYMLILLFFSNETMPYLRNKIILTLANSPYFILQMLGRTFSALKVAIFLGLFWSFIFIFLQIVIIKTSDKRIKYAGGLISIIIVISTIFNSWPLFTGDMGSVFKETNIPTEYLKISDITNGSCKMYRSVLWPPIYGGYQPSWKTSPMPADYLFTYGSQCPTYEFLDSFPVKYFYNYVLNPKFSPFFSDTSMSDISFITNSLSAIGVKYLIVHRDIDKLAPLVTSLENNLKNNIGILNIYKGSIISIYDISQGNKIVDVKSTPFLIAGGYNTLYKFSTIVNNSLIFENSSWVFLDLLLSRQNGRYYLDFLENNGSVIILTPSKTIFDIIAPILLTNTTDVIVIPPAIYTQEYSVSGSWSRAYLSDPHHAQWSLFIGSEIQNYKWEFSYDINYGIAVASGESILNIPLKIDNKNNTTYHIYARILKHEDGGKIRVFLDDFSKTINTKENKTNAEFVWIKIGKVRLNKGEHILRIENLNGRNAINLLVLIPEDKFNQVKNKVSLLLKNKTIVYVFDVDKDVYYDSEGNGSFYVNILKNGTYRIGISGLKSSNIIVDTWSVGIQYENSSWRYSEPIRLKKGTNLVKVNNMYDNLVCNPSFENGTLCWKKVVTGKVNVTCDSSTKIEGQYSLMILTNETEHVHSQVYQDIYIEPGMDYIVEFNVKTKNTNSTHIVISTYNSSSEKWERVSIFKLRGDWHMFRTIIKTAPDTTKIRIALYTGWVSDPSKGPGYIWLDGVKVYAKDRNKFTKIIIFTTSNINTNETLEELFQVKEKPAQVQNYTKINPTLWKVKVNATKPFFLTFAESYDPLWEARVYKDGKLVEKVKPVPVYGVINGFWINQTGDLEIVLRYTPQDWFERGLIISLTTFVLSIFYIFYDWRREKGDRWAGRLEEKFKRLAENVKSRIFRR